VGVGVLFACEYLLDEGDHLWCRGVDEVPAADGRDAGVGSACARASMGSWNSCGEWEAATSKARVLDGGERGGVGLEPAFALELRESGRTVSG
jgi:hypothetical protein